MCSACQPRQDSGNAAFTRWNEQVTNDPGRDALHRLLAEAAEPAIKLWIASTYGIQIAETDGERLTLLHGSEAECPRAIRKNRSEAEPCSGPQDMADHHLRARRNDHTEPPGYNAKHTSWLIVEMVCVLSRLKCSELCTAQKGVSQPIGFVGQPTLSGQC